METLIPESIPPVVAFFPFFVAIYLVAYFVIFRSWTPQTRPEASSCAISLFHSTAALFVASFSLFEPTHVPGFASANTLLQNITLEYSIAYFIMDLVHYLIFYPSDLLFVGHHLATLFVFVTCRYAVSHGAFAVLVLLILAESTSMLQNVWTLAKARRHDVQFAAKLYELLSLPFYSLYSVVRGLVGPYFVYRMLIFYSSGGADGLIPTWVWASWIVVVAVAIAASILWVWNLWGELFRERYGEQGKKKRFDADNWKLHRIHLHALTQRNMRCIGLPGWVVNAWKTVLGGLAPHKDIQQIDERMYAALVNCQWNKGRKFNYKN